jgi:hypothetical protein
MPINFNEAALFENRVYSAVVTLLLDGDPVAEITPGSVPINRSLAFNQIRIASDSTTFTQNPDVPVSTIPGAQPVLTYSDEHKTL